MWRLSLFFLLDREVFLFPLPSKPCPRSYPASAGFIGNTLVSACCCKLYVQSLLYACRWQILVKDEPEKSQLKPRGVVYLQRDSPLPNGSTLKFQFHPNIEEGGFNFDLEGLKAKLAAAKDGEATYNEVLKLFGTVVLCH